jgi:hypothetical protein
MLLTAHPQQRQPGLFTHPEQLHTHSHTQLPSPLSHSLHIVLYVERESSSHNSATPVLSISQDNQPSSRINHQTTMLLTKLC